MPGPFGRELLVRHARSGRADGRTGHQTQRFAGVDGPRWFLRAVFQGPAVHRTRRPPPSSSRWSADVVVVRGAEAMAPRELLPLRLPEAADAGRRRAEPEQADGRSLDPFERGPEITEIR